MHLTTSSGRPKKSTMVSSALFCILFLAIPIQTHFTINPVDILMLEISAFDNEVRSIIYHDMLKVVKLPLNVFHLKIMSNLEGMYSTYIV